jgi:DNA helicase-2/ATP-dependent DNA helicase PcrA
MPGTESKLKKEDLEGNTLIIANPGTGKTTSLADRVVDLLKAGVPEKEILCITFTTKAAQEMRERIESKIKDAKLGGAKPAEIAVHTFHSYALDYLASMDRDYQIIGNNAIRYSIYKSFKRNDALNYGNDYIIGEIVPKSENAIRYLKSFGILPDMVDIGKAAEELRKVYADEEISNITLEENLKFLDYFVDAFRDYEGAKPKGFLDYNDLLIGFVRKHDRAKRHYRHVLVDELQDVNELEAEIAAKSGDSLFLVGDRKQAIFGFQGGSVSNFRRFSAESAHKKTLTLNYRSPQRVLDYARVHFLNNTKDGTYVQELDGLKSNDDARIGEVQVIVSDMQSNAAIRKALELMAGGNGSVAIITRTNGQLLEVSKILDAKSVEYSSTISNATSDSAKNEIIAFLRGVLYDDQDTIVRALFTPFSGVPLRDAFTLSEKYHAGELADADMGRLAAPFHERRRAVSSLEGVQRLFPELILPISMSISKDYFITASSLQKNISEFFSTVGNPTREDLFSYLAVTEESYEPIGKQRRLVLTTVHKAKGLEFDDVVYAPKEARDRFSFIDAVVYAIIKSATERDIREELEEEKLRVDFVAFTRTRNNLYIVTTPKSQSKYAIDGLSGSVSMAADDEPEPLGRNYDNAYGMFVAGSYDKAREALERRDDWLDELIRTSLGGMKRLSFSQVMASGSPYGFLKYQILKVPQRIQALNTGLMVHQMAEERFNGNLKVESVAVEGKGYLSNINTIDNEIKSRYGARQIAAEEQIVLRAAEAFDLTGADSMDFKGTLDAVYVCDDGGYLIVDWKTDKAKDYDTEHRKQLAVYRRLYSKAHGVEEDKISTAIAYVGLRGKINTGRLDFELEDVKPTATLIKNFEKQAQRLVDYLRDPSAFISAVLEDENDEMLYEIVRRELA